MLLTEEDRLLWPTMNLNRSFRSRDGGPFVVFLVLSLVINGAGAYCGWWLKFPEPPPLKDDAIELTAIDTNDVEKLGDPNAQEEPPPPEPEPTPPPEPEPTPPPLDKPPEFEIPDGNGNQRLRQLRRILRNLILAQAHAANCG